MPLTPQREVELKKNLEEVDAKIKKLKETHPDLPRDPNDFAEKFRLKVRRHPDKDADRNLEEYDELKDGIQLTESALALFPSLKLRSEIDPVKINRLLGKNKEVVKEIEAKFDQALLIEARMVKSKPFQDYKALCQQQKKITDELKGPTSKLPEEEEYKPRGPGF